MRIIGDRPRFLVNGSRKVGHRLILLEDFTTVKSKISRC